MTEARKRANKKYDAKAYDMVSFRFPKGKKATLQSYAASRGESLNGFVNHAIDDYIKAHGSDVMVDNDINTDYDEEEDMAFCVAMYERYLALPDEEKEIAGTIEELAEELGIKL